MGPDYTVIRIARLGGPVTFAIELIYPAAGASDGYLHGMPLDREYNKALKAISQLNLERRAANLPELQIVPSKTS